MRGATSPAASAADQIAMTASRALRGNRAELLQALAGFLEHVVRLRKAEADPRQAELRVRVQRGARHCGDADLLDEPHGEGRVVGEPQRLDEVRGIREDVVRPARLP